MSAWGDDDSKWVVQKSAYGSGWIVFPPHDGEPYMVADFPFTPSEYLRTDNAFSAIRIYENAGRVGSPTENTPEKEQQ